METEGNEYYRVDDVFDDDYYDYYDDIRYGQDGYLIIIRYGPDGNAIRLRLEQYDNLIRNEKLHRGDDEEIIEKLIKLITHPKELSSAQATEGAVKDFEKYYLR